MENNTFLDQITAYKQFPISQPVDSRQVYGELFHNVMASFFKKYPLETFPFKVEFQSSKSPNLGFDCFVVTGSIYVSYSVKNSLEDSIPVKFEVLGDK